jgi:hypothetical protein
LRGTLPLTVFVTVFVTVVAGAALAAFAGLVIAATSSDFLGFFAFGAASDAPVKAR